MTTIKDVAKLSGFSISTVSRAISGKAYVNPEAKAKILHAVEVLGYTPNHIAKGLKEGRTNTIGLILPDISNLFYPKVIKSVQQTAAEKGLSLILANTDEKPATELDAIESMRKIHVDGILVLPTSSEVLRKLLSCRNSRTPCVILNRYYDVGVDCITNDDHYGGYTMMRYLIQKGHRKICVVLRSFQHFIYKERYEGCLKALRESGLEDSERYFLFDIDTIDMVFQKVLGLVRQKDHPTAFFITNDMFTLGAYNAVKTAGYHIPNDISIVGYDNIILAPHMFPPLTTYEAPVDEIARCAVDRVMAAANDPDLPAQIQFLKGKIIERDSVRDIASEKADAVHDGSDQTERLNG